MRQAIEVVQTEAFHGFVFCIALIRRTEQEIETHPDQAVLFANLLRTGVYFSFQNQYQNQPWRSQHKTSQWRTQKVLGKTHWTLFSKRQ